MYRMFYNSSQKKCWLFKDDEVLTNIRKKTNESYIYNIKTSHKDDKLSFLTTEEETIMVRYYEACLKRFLLDFMPKREILPRPVKAIAYHFYKRFFLVTSVMDYHPREIMLTCVFLACKIGEYHLPLNLFADSVREYRENPGLLRQIILDQEPELLVRCNFQLNIHTPYKALEGFIIQIKTLSMFQEPDVMRNMMEHVHRFLNSVWLTDVCLLFTPALIALAAVMNAATRCHRNIDNFIITTILGSPPPEKLNDIIKDIRKIRKMVSSNMLPANDESLQQLKIKLNHCRNPLNNPFTEKFRIKMMENVLSSYKK